MRLLPLPVEVTSGELAAAGFAAAFVVVAWAVGDGVAVLSGSAELVVLCFVVYWLWSF